MSNPGPMSLLLSVLLFFFCEASSSLLSLPDYYLLHNQSFSTEPQEYLDPTLPPLLPPTGAPSCSVHVLQHEFANTYGSPPASTSFIPPEACPPPWLHVVLDLSISCFGDQYDRIAAVWIAGAEVLRTSTAEPTDSGIFWRVRKDVTNYASLLRNADGVEISMMLENIVNDIYTGIYKANLSLEFYPDSDDVISLGRSKRGRNALEIRPYDPFMSGSKLGKVFEGEKKKLLPALEDPADLIIPVCRKNSSNGYWFRIYNQSDEHFARINILGTLSELFLKCLSPSIPTMNFGTRILLTYTSRITTSQVKGETALSGRYSPP
ncbi:hypothetical protein HPP92_000633 [Vanilla planifolia]|uniref:Peptide N-acetyl-beta-D-glucosaminyl asparaginase amidase A N-terminal domain-containing protein n=1 Tax=Vanilla planifolia TaxID=51239 RepID=A0A835VL33_VANPL|nr:hypothetical protein HPP92_000633 [Vanilla planifolia]